MTEHDTKNFIMSVAGHSFYIHALYGDAYKLCKDYLTTDPAEIEINISLRDVEYENLKEENKRFYSRNGYLETLAIYRKISEAILDFDTFLMHGAVVAHDGKAYMFTAPSGTGKTTHIRKWLDNLDDVYVVNGDKPLVKIVEKGAIACGTPWCGKEGLGKNCLVPLKAIVLMERGENNKIKEISFNDAFNSLLRQVYMPENSEKMRKTLTLIAQLKEKVKFYKFTFNNMKEDTFIVAYKALTNNSQYKQNAD